MLASAFILGLAGSLHCAGMCGPLVLMTPVVGKTRSARNASRLLYHFGRIAIYALLGLLFGAIGQSIALAGFQRGLSIFAGMAMILCVIAAGPLKAQLWKMPLKLKSLFGAFLQQPSLKSIFALGAINGLLPCGLVYIAAAASVAQGRALYSVAYMIMFGLGTAPILLFVSIAGRGFRASPILQKVAPAAAIAVALLLIARAQPLSLLASGNRPIACPACSE